jgi:hypothetical protein
MIKAVTFRPLEGIELVLSCLIVASEKEKHHNLRIESKRAGGGHCVKHRWEGDRQHGCPSETGGHSP